MLTTRRGASSLKQEVAGEAVLACGAPLQRRAPNHAGRGAALTMLRCALAVARRSLSPCSNSSCPDASPRSSISSCSRALQSQEVKRVRMMLRI